MAMHKPTPSAPQSLLDEFIRGEERVSFLRAVAYANAQIRIGITDLYSPKLFKQAFHRGSIKQAVDDARSLIYLYRNFNQPAVLIDEFSSRLSRHSLPAELSDTLVQTYMSALNTHYRDFTRMWKVEEEAVFLLEKTADVLAVAQQKVSAEPNGSCDQSNGGERGNGCDVVESRYLRMWEQIEEQKRRVTSARKLALIIYRHVLHDAGVRALQLTS